MFKFTFKYIDIYVCIFLAGHNLCIFWARKLKIGMLLFQTWTFNSVLELHPGPALGQNV